jgi:2-hydroxy-6-oxonona-2,4-dienedioate hydrolase
LSREIRRGDICAPSELPDPLDMRQHDSIWTDLMGVPFRQAYVDVNGVKTRYLATGEGKSDTLIFLHGTSGHAEAYTRNLGPHGDHFSTYSIDMIGNGLTDKPATDLEIPVYVDHLRGFMDAMGIEKAAISGESLGGWVAAQFTLDHPHRVQKLVLNTTGGRTAYPQVMARIVDLSMAAVNDPSWDRIKSRLEFLMADPAKVHDDLVATRQRIYAMPGMVDAMRRNLVLQNMETRKRNLIPDDKWAAISAPTLVLWTSHDPTAAATEGKKIADLIPGAQFVVLEGCGHWPQFEDATTFNRLHLSFLLSGKAPVS